MPRTILDPRLMSTLRDSSFPSRATFRTVTFTTNAANQPVPNGGTPIPAMTGIPCRIGPLIELRPSDTEVRTAQIQEKQEHRQLKLSGYFPQIQTRVMDAVVDGVPYRIVGNEADSQLFCSRLRLEAITPGPVS